MFADQGDILIAISSSGNSENIINAVNSAYAKKCNVITLSGFSHKNKLRNLGYLNFYVPSESYGHVEIIHLSVLHSIIDIITMKNNDHEKQNIRNNRNLIIQ